MADEFKETASNGDCSSSHHQWAFEVMERLAGQLTDPTSGDIVFKISRSGENDFLIYAWRHILESNSGNFLRGIIAIPSVVC